MSRLQGLKKIVDHEMQDIIVTDELRERTLKRCKIKPISTFKTLTAVACCIMVLGIANISGILPLKFDTDKGVTPDQILMNAPPNGSESLPEGVTIDLATNNGMNGIKHVETIEQAQQLFGEGFLIPSSIPERFVIDTINAYNIQDNQANKIILGYKSQKDGFSIIQEKTMTLFRGTDSKRVVINNNIGYIRSSMIDDGSKTDNYLTEVYWAADGVFYSIIGVITEDEAMLIAEALNQLQ